MRREQLERHQVWIYAAAIALGLAVGARAPAIVPPLETLVWPVLGVLLYVTFTQVPLTHLPAGARDLRFVGAVLAGNFVLVPPHGDRLRHAHRPPTARGVRHRACARAARLEGPDREAAGRGGGAAGRSVLFLIAASQLHVVSGALPLLGRVAAAFALYLVAAAAIGTALARAAA